MLLLTVLAFGFFTEEAVSMVLGDPRQPWEPGLICNYETYLSSRGRVLLKYLCVPAQACKNETYRSPHIPFDRCGTDLLPEPGVERFTCCHPSDIVDKTLKRTAGEAYLPGVRSFTKCKDYGHLVCKGTNVSLCYKDMADFGSRMHHGQRTTLNKHPYMALIGHEEIEINKRFSWYCRGTIIAEKYILTAASCDVDTYVFGTHVKVGEERLCETCVRRAEEQIIKIRRIFKFPQYNDFYFYSDIAVVELEDEIVFNRFVRPACLFPDSTLFFNDSTFAGYGVDDRELNDIMTPAMDPDPVYQSVPLGNVIVFSVKAVSDAVVTLADYGLPSDTDHLVEVVIGSSSNSKTVIRVKHEGDKEVVDTPNILSKTQKTQFWIKHNNEGEIEFGKKEEMNNPLLRWENPTPYTVINYGVSTPGDFGGDWSLSTASLGFTPQETDLSLLYRDECLPYYKSYETLDDNATLYDELMFCGWKHSTEEGICSKDKGGATVIQLSGAYCMWQVVGVLAADIKNPQGCTNTLSRPAIFTRVADYHLNWVESVVWGYDFNMTSLKLYPPDCTLNIGKPKRPGQCPD